jgi:peptidoglycan L-alanyl-D-glutamate endopeptidase CwlK
MPQFGSSSKKNLYECEQPLIDLFEEVVKHYDCSIIEGARTKEEQDKLFHAGKSKLKWPDSKHNITDTQPKSLAVDVIPYPSVLNGKSIWEDLNRFYYFIGFVTGVAAEMGIPIRLGADWDGDRNLKQAFVDLPHVELVTENFSQF